MRNRPLRFATLTRRLAIYYSALAAGAIVLTCARAAAATGAPAPAWDARFQRTNGWIGADGDYSIPLGGGTTLWLYSDTFVGKVRDGKRLDARMIHNSIALQDGDGEPEFFYGAAADGGPAAFIRPERGSSRDYFWLAHGARAVGGLYFFMQRVVTVKRDTPFGFKLLDGWLARVANPDDPPPQWRITQTKVPFTRVAAKGALIFGNAVLPEGEFVYIFGGDSRPAAKGAARPNGMVVARVPVGALGDFAQWRFLAGGEWQPDARKVTPVFPNVGSEFSVSWLAARRQYAAVYSVGLGGDILLRTAPALVGPWSDAALVYRCPEMKWAPGVFCYAAKAHAELAPAPDELLITYAANAWNFWDLFSDAKLYWPRFVRVNLGAE